MLHIALPIKLYYTQFTGIKMENYRFLADEDELKFFWDYGLPPLKQNEIYFISLSARNKLLTEEERLFYQLGRSEMFGKQQIRHDNFGVLLQHIKRFECRRDAYLTKAGIPYPQKVLRVYLNLTPIDAYKAMKDQINYLTEVLTSLTDSALNNSKNGIDDSFYKVRKSFDTCQSLFARNFGTKEWIDIDIDLNEDYSEKLFCDIKTVFKEYFSENSDVMFIRTSGGIHCLIRKNKLKTNPDDIYKKLSHIVKAKEIVRNTNEMIPCPGTYMDEDFIVRVLNKNDFSEEDKLHKD